MTTVKADRQIEQREMTINAAAVDSSSAAASRLVVSLTEWAGSVYKHPDPQLLPLGECSRSFSDSQEEGTRKIALADLGRNDFLPYKIETHQTCCAKWVFANSCRRHLGIMIFRHMAETFVDMHHTRYYLRKGTQVERHHYQMSQP